MALHPDYLRCLGLAEALKVLAHMKRFDTHFHTLLLRLEVKLNVLEGVVDLGVKEKERLKSCRITYDKCVLAWDRRDYGPTQYEMSSFQKIHE